MLLLRFGVIVHVFAVVLAAADPEDVIIKLPSNRCRSQCLQKKGHADTYTGVSKDDSDYVVYKEPYDLHIEVGDRSISAHKRTIAATIPYFDVPNDSVEAKIKDLLAQELNPMAVESVFRFAYTSQIKINQGNVEAILKASRFLQTETVLSACNSYLIKGIDDQNLVNIVNNVESDKVLKSAADKYIQDNFSTFSLSREFLDLTPDSFIRILRSNEIRNSSEEQKFEGAFRWIQHNENDRNIFVYEVMENVRLNSLSYEYLTQNVFPKFGNSKNIRVRQMVSVAIKDVNQGCESRQRGGTTKFISIPNSNNSAAMQIFDPVSQKFEKISKTPNKRYYCSIIYNCNVLLIGGRTSHNSADSNSVDLYNPKSDSWGNIEPMLEKRVHPSAAVVNGIIYVCGGFFGTTQSKTTESYNPHTKTWTYLASMTKGRYRHELLALGDNLYVIGGYSNDDTVEMYNIFRKEWTRVKPMLSGRSDFGAAVLNGKLYVCGGRSSSVIDYAEVYDPTNDVWSPIASMIRAKMCFTLVAYNGQLWAFQGTVPSIEVYDPEEDKWTKLLNLSESENMDIIEWMTHLINF